MASFSFGMFMDSSLSTGSLANWDRVLLAINTFSIGSLLVLVLWKQCLRQGVACSYDKNANLVAYFIGGIYHVCICGCYSVFLLLIVGSALFVAAGYVAYPKWFQYRTLICLKDFIKDLPFMALIPLLMKPI